MDYEKQLFEKSKVKAPNDFVKNTMKHIQLKEIEEQEKKVAKIEYSFVKLGQICVVTALLLIALNVFPATKTVYGQGFNFQPKCESITEKIADTYDEVAEGITQFFDWDVFNNKNDNKGDK